MSKAERKKYRDFFFGGSSGLVSSGPPSDRLSFFDCSARRDSPLLVVGPSFCSSRASEVAPLHFPSRVSAAISNPFFPSSGLILSTSLVAALLGRCGRLNSDSSDGGDGSASGSVVNSFSEVKIDLGTWFCMDESSVRLNNEADQTRV